MLVGNVPKTVTVFVDVDVRIPEDNAKVVQAIGLSRTTPLRLFTVKVPRLVEAGNSNPVVILAATVGATYVALKVTPPNANVGKVARIPPERVIRKVVDIPKFPKVNAEAFKEPS
jgi:hypothetical protein